MKIFTIGLSVTLLVLSSATFANTAVEVFHKGFLSGELNWKFVQKQAKKEGVVNLYYWGGNDTLNVWIDRVATPALKKEGVRLNAVRITSIKDAIDLVLAEKNSNKGIGEGSVDAIWLNGENFATLKRQDALFGSFAEKLPNAINYEWDASDSRSQLNLRDFGVETSGQELPWSGEQYVCAVNKDRVNKSEIPSSFADLQRYLQKNPGKFTYIKPPSYIGNTFVQAAIYAHNPDGTGAEPFQSTLKEIGAKELARLIKPGLEYLKSIEPLLLGANGGKARYPEELTALDGLFLNGEVNFNCKFGTYSVATGLKTGTYPEAAEEFVFPKGYMIRNKNYLTIPSNSPNPAAALTLLNYMASVDSQVSKLKHVGMPAGIDHWKLSSKDAASLVKASPGLIGIKQTDLDANSVADANATLVDVIEATWLEYIERDSKNSITEIVARAVKNLR